MQDNGASAQPAGPSQAEPEDVSALRASVPCAARVEMMLRLIVKATHSHIDGRDLLDELHPRKTLDIKRRVDGRETWFEGDWLSDLKREVDRAKSYLFSLDHAQAIEARRAATGNTDAVHESAVPTGCAQGDPA